jgi:hypothetical protein
MAVLNCSLSSNGTVIEMNGLKKKIVSNVYRWKPGIGKSIMFINYSTNKNNYLDNN